MRCDVLWKLHRARGEFSALTAEDYLEQGKKLFEEGLYEKALRAYKRALELDPKSFMVYDSMALIYQRSGDVERAYTGTIRPSFSPYPPSNIWVLIWLNRAI